MLETTREDHPFGVKFIPPLKPAHLGHSSEV